MTLDDIRKFLTSRYVLHLEDEVQHLRGRVSLLEIQVEVARNPPKPAPLKREIPVVKQVKTSWEQYLEEEIRKQETENPEDGIHSGGR